MFIALTILLAAAVFLIVAYPIVTKTQVAAPATTSAEGTLDELTAHREAVFQALRELNFDHQVGKITDEDFGVFEANLKQVDADALRALDSWEARVDDDSNLALEREIEARRAALSRGGRACPACQSPAALDDKFCATCGASLPAPAEAAATQACPQCGKPFEPGDRFCAGCGQAL